MERSAKRNRKSLGGNNFYGNKLAEVRADATNAFRELSEHNVGDTSALAELIETCFSPSVTRENRLVAGRALAHELNTTWKGRPGTGNARPAQELFPLSLLARANRGYLIGIGRQMNGSYAAGWYDATAVMMRRLLEVSIIEAFEGKGLSAKIQNSNDDFLQLSDLIAAALSETSWNLSRNTRTNLPKLRDVGHCRRTGATFWRTKRTSRKSNWVVESWSRSFCDWPDSFENQTNIAKQRRKTRTGCLGSQLSMEAS